MVKSLTLVVAKDSRQGYDNFIIMTRATLSSNYENDHEDVATSSHQESTRNQATVLKVTAVTRINATFCV